jgi:Mn-dependent DtxR family transcriptional regulator
MKARRLKLSPPDPADVQKLIEMGYVEMKGDEPVMTSEGAREVDIAD